MFTGIIESCGTVTALERNPESSIVTIAAPEILNDVTAGASVSVNGVCLTVVDFTSDSFRADVMLETLNRSTLGTLKPGSSVNLERAMPVNGRFGGHIVQGHVDATGVIKEIREEPDWTIMRIAVPREISRYIVEKGSITVDGVSLTVVQVSDVTERDPEFSISLIPTTLRETNLGSMEVGATVNIEVDALAKYVERIMGAQRADLAQGGGE